MKTTPHRRITAALVASAICFAPMATFAQENTPEEEWMIASSTSTFYTFLPITLIALAGALVTIGGGVTTTTTLQGTKQEKIPRHQLAALLDSYLSEHPEAWFETASLGGGLLIDDLSGVLALRPEDRGAFGVALRQQRQALLALLDAPRGLERGHHAATLLLDARATLSVH